MRYPDQNQRKMVEKLNTILLEMKRIKGDVFMFALMKIDDVTDKWTLILSAPWATEGDREIFRYVLDLIKTGLGEDISDIARIGIFTRGHHLIEELMKYRSGAEIHDKKVNGNLVHEGYVIESNQTPSEPVRQEQLFDRGV